MGIPSLAASNAEDNKPLPTKLVVAVCAGRRNDARVTMLLCLVDAFTSTAQPNHLGVYIGEGGRTISEH